MNLFQTDPEKEKTKEQRQLLTILLLAGIGYYLFFFLPEQRNNTKKRIETLFQYHQITPTELDSNLWKGFKSYKEKLDKLYFPTQISKFSENMIEAIETRKKEIEEKKFKNIKEARDKAINSIKEFAKKEIEKVPAFEKEVKKFYQRINQASADNISSITDEVNTLITQQKNKRQKLHWLREPKNWADKKLEILKSDFEQAWNQYSGLVNPHNEPNKQPEKCVFVASYTINFPPSLWDDLTEEEKRCERAKKLELKPEVQDYEFNNKVSYWYYKVLNNPIRGERDKSNIDNNAILYGAPRTGKSIIMEKLAYESDRLPLVIIQGSALTPTINDQKCGIDNFKKFIYTICDINNTLVDDFGFERNSESGEPQYIFFIDEANQISENTFMKSPCGLTFLKECMGSDNYKQNESLNLWVAATNYLDQLDQAVYQPGRLGNRLSFSWTLGDFKKYASKAGIITDFPSHWIDINSLNEEDNKWVNRFNVIHFEESFLGKKMDGRSVENATSFWDKFINNEENKKKLPEIKETNEQGEEIIKQKGIQIGEFIHFFWLKFDSNELYDDDFDAKFEKPREPKMEKVVGGIGTQIKDAIDIRLRELGKTVDQIKNEMEIANNVYVSNLNKSTQKIADLLTEIGKRIK